MKLSILVGLATAKSVDNKCADLIGKVNGKELIKSFNSTLRAMKTQNWPFYIEFSTIYNVTQVSLKAKKAGTRIRHSFQTGKSQKLTTCSIFLAIVCVNLKTK